MQVEVEPPRHVIAQAARDTVISSAHTKNNCLTYADSVTSNFILNVKIICITMFWGNIQAE